MRRTALKHLVTGLALVASVGSTHAQWAAYNDHDRGTGTAPNVSTWSITAANTTVGGPLTNFATGQLTSPSRVGVQIAHVGILNGATGGSTAPNAGTPAALVFGGKVDWTASALYFGGAGGLNSSAVTITFTNLTPGRLYRFRGTAIRGGSYATRWTLATLAGASNSKPAHQAGPGSAGIITNGWPTYGVNLTPGTQAAWNSGDNVEGDLIGWDNIAPIGNTFSIINSNWTEATPGGAGNTTYCYAINAFMLEEAYAPAFIVTQPQGGSVCAGSPLNLSVVAGGGAPYWYQWKLGGVNIANATNATYSVASAGPGNAGSYTVVVSNTLSAVTSAVATVTVASIGINTLTGPANTTVFWGDPAIFSVVVNASASQPIFRWFKSTNGLNSGGTLIAGANASTYTIPSATEANIAYYYVIASNCVNWRTSQVASLGISYRPVVITTQPQNVTVVQGAAATLTVGATGSALRYQWYKGSAPIANATNTSYTVANAQLANSGIYHVVVSSPGESVESSSAILFVSLPPISVFGYTNQTWRYNQSGTDLGTAWRAPSFNDSAWPTGRGAFAWENNAVVNALTNTVLSLSNAAGAYIRTFYFRTTFVFTNDLDLYTVTSSNLLDDGVVVYLNGVEAYRWNMPTTTIAWTTLAPTANPLGEGVAFVTNLPPHMLVQGTNSLAVEVHQAGTASSDVVFDLSVNAAYQSPSLIEITNQPANVTVVEFKPALFNVGFIGAAAKVQWYKWNTNTGQPDPVAGGVWPTLTLTNTAFGVDEGYFFAVISNVLGVVASSNAFLTIIPDTNAPILLEADGTLSVSNVTLTFNEPLARTPASPALSPTNLANYTITNTAGGSLTVTQAVFVNTPSNATVVLRTSAARTAGLNWIATVRNVRDASPRANLGSNLAAPISSLIPVINWNGSWRYANPAWGFTDPITDFMDTRWAQPAYEVVYPWASDPEPAPFFSPDLATIGVDLPAPGGTRLGNVAGNDLMSSYFRNQFNFRGSPAGASIQMSHFIADGAIFYFNGAEFMRYNMPAGAVNYFTIASGRIADPNTRGPTNVPATTLQQGTNLIAVEIHAALTNIPPVLDPQGFAVELSARIESLVTNKVVITSSPRDLTVVEGEPALLDFHGAGGATFQWRTNAQNPAITPDTSANGTSPTYYIPRTPLHMNGWYFSVRVTGLSNSVQDSASARLTVLPDTNAPTFLAYLTAPNTITVTFNEPVNATTAGNRANYWVTNLSGANPTISTATIVNGTNVVLTFGSLPPGTYQLVASNIRDTAQTPNTIPANSRATVGLLNYTLIALDAATQWRYDDQNEDLGTAWRAFDYNDSAWPQGAALFDYKTGTTNPRGGLPETVRTVLGGVDGAANIPTYYFRRKFTVPVLAAGATMTVRHILDDGAAFYLNGQLCYAIGVATPTTFTALASRTVGDGAYEGPFNVPVTNLALGTNVMAVELKQQSATSSDITFGATLVLNVPSFSLPALVTNVPPPSRPILAIARQAPNNVRVSWTNSSYNFTLQAAIGVNPTNTLWTNVANQTNPYLVPATNAARYYRLRWQ
ncbi:MAG: hypothetical protein HZA90_23085 [Verrucomicrobia bacterium]|nr:hypothetical protein [Verrucomicrobiota bacterium]